MSTAAGIGCTRSNSIFDVTARLISRNELDWTPRFRRIAKALPSVSGGAILDGEIVAIDESGGGGGSWVATNENDRRTDGTGSLRMSCSLLQQMTTSFHARPARPADAHA